MRNVIERHHVACRALEFLKTADELEPGSLPTAMLRLSVHLGAGSETGAAAAVAALAECCAAQPDALRIACVQAIDAGATAAARKALLCLLERCSAASPPAAVGGGGGSTAVSSLQAPGFEATVFQNLIHLLLADGSGIAVRGSQAAGAAAEGAEPSLHCQLACLYDQAVQRMRAVGPEAFFTLQEGRALQQEWFAAQVGIEGEGCARGAHPACCEHMPQPLNLRRLVHVSSAGLECWAGSRHGWRADSLSSAAFGVRRDVCFAAGTGTGHSAQAEGGWSEPADLCASWCRFARNNFAAALLPGFPILQACQRCALDHSLPCHASSWPSSWQRPAPATSSPNRRLPSADLPRLQMPMRLRRQPQCRAALPAWHWHSPTSGRLEQRRLHLPSRRPRWGPRAAGSRAGTPRAMSSCTSWWADSAWAPLLESRVLPAC